MTLSLSDIAQQVHLVDAAAAKVKVIVRPVYPVTCCKISMHATWQIMAMMERGEIGATIDAAMDMVSFNADLDRASSHALLDRLEKQMQVNVVS